MLLSPWRPQTTMAIEKVKRAARDAQPAVISMDRSSVADGTLPSVVAARYPPALTSSSPSSSPTAVQERQRVRQTYPNFKVVVLNDDVNTFQHVVECLVRFIPGMQADQAWDLAHQIDSEGSAVVWCGPQEQAELYHQQLGAEGLTMAPLEPA